MTAGWAHNLEAYRLITDVLVTFRRIVARAVVKSGAEGDEVVWPPDVLARLRRRWREEVETERHPTPEDDVIAFATFADLAELVTGEGEVGALLSRLTPASGELVDLLKELEILRWKVAIARPLAEAELARLRELQDEFREMLAGRGTGRRRSSPAGGGPVRARGPATGPDAPATAPPRPRPALPVVPPPDAAKAPSLKPAPSPAPAPVPPPPPPVAAQRAKAGASGQRSTPQPAPSPQKRAELRAEAIAAIASGETRSILRELHHEVMALADGVHTGAGGLAAPMWRALLDRSWVEDHRDQLGLDPLLRFHALIDVLADIDLAADERRKALADAGFASLLLELRQMFRRHLG